MIRYVSTCWDRRTSLLCAVLLIAATLCAPVFVTPAAAQRGSNAEESSQETHARKLFVRGMTRAFLEDYDAAVAYYEQALGLTPKEAPILSALAEAKSKNDDVSAATFYAEKARDASPENVAYHRQLATLQRENGLFREAIQSYERLLERFPSDIDARMRLAEVQIEAQRPEAAIGTYESILEKGHDTAQLRVALLQLYRQSNDAGGIETSLKALTKQRPEDQIYLHLLGQFYVEHGRSDEAITLYEDLLAKQPANADLLIRLASTYRSNGQPDKADELLSRFVNDAGATADQLVARARTLTGSAEVNARQPGALSERRSTAEQLLERALDKQSDHTDALAMLGDLKYQSGEYEQAAALLERALEQNPRSPSRWTRASAAFLRAGQPERAHALADEGLLLFPGQAPLLRVSGYSHMQVGSNATAISRLQEALARTDEDSAQRSPVNGALGLLYARIQQFTKSDAAYARALDANPENAAAANNYAFSLADRDVHLDRALRLARRAVRIDSTNASYLDTLGWIFFKRGDLNDAEVTLKKALDTGNASAAVYEHYGDVSEALGNTETARVYWQKALNRAPGRDQVQEKLNALQDD